MKILIMGLPGAGKTTLAAALVKQLRAAGQAVAWLNADQIRTIYDDWDFSRDGRLRQAERMNMMAQITMFTNHVVCDFIAPTNEIRDNFGADMLIWADTINESRYADTNKVFEAPATYDVRVTEQDAEKWAEFICKKITNPVVKKEKA